MNTEVKFNPCTAETLYVSHPQASYGTFCYNSMGDLFLSSDWGFHCYAWRAYGDDFKKFLRSCNSEYIMGKFESNYRNVTLKAMPATMKKNVAILVDEFINYLRNN